MPAAAQEQEVVTPARQMRPRVGEAKSTQKKARLTAHSSHTADQHPLEFRDVSIVLLAQQLNAEVSALPTDPLELDNLATVREKFENGCTLFQVQIRVGGK